LVWQAGAQEPAAAIAGSCFMPDYAKPTVSDEPAVHLEPGPVPPDPAAALPVGGEVRRRTWSGRLFALRRDGPIWVDVVLGVACLAVIGGIWYWLTAGEIREERILSPAVLPSPADTFSPEKLRSLWFDKTLTMNTLASLRRVVLGFGLALVVGVPIGVLAGCFGPVRAFFPPLTVFGRNVPIAALIGLTFSLFGTGELQKVMFLFIACFAFVISDTTNAIRDISQRYVDTALTLGASRWQVIAKVLVPLAMPSVFNSVRLLFGLAFGYIMLAELVTAGGTYGGLGHIINMAQSRGGDKEHILLVLMIIPLVALGIDRVLYLTQRSLFPHQYGGHGTLHRLLGLLLRVWEDARSLVIRPTPLPEAWRQLSAAGPATDGPVPAGPAQAV
jgi:ABC-type nitrate/sulfonate/bicarbonate transport system permease component